MKIQSPLWWLVVRIPVARYAPTIAAESVQTYLSAVMRCVISDNILKFLMRDNRGVYCLSTSCLNTGFH